MTANEKIRCGVAGVGYLGQHHARIYNEIGSCDLVGIYEPSEEAANESSSFMDAKGLNQLRNWVKHVMQSAWYAQPICTQKYQFLLIKRNCHLLIEKPLCVSSEEAEKILSYAQDFSTIVQVGHIEHYNPVMEFLEDAVELPRYLTVERLALFQIRGTEVGVVLDLMIHDIGIVMALIGSPIEDGGCNWGRYYPTRKILPMRD